MKTVLLSQKLPDFVREIENLDSSKGRVYRTTVHSPKSPVSETFLTTSKDLHLEFGRMSEELQWALATLIRQELGTLDGVIMLFAKDDHPIGILATLVMGGDKLVIHLSKASS